MSPWRFHDGGANPGCKWVRKETEIEVECGLYSRKPDGPSYPVSFDMFVVSRYGSLPNEHMVARSLQLYSVPPWLGEQSTKVPLCRPRTTKC